MYTIDTIGRTRLLSQFEQVDSLPRISETKVVMYLNISAVKHQDLPSHIDVVFNSESNWSIFIMCQF